MFPHATPVGSATGAGSSAGGAAQGGAAQGPVDMVDLGESSSDDANAQEEWADRDIRPRSTAPSPAEVAARLKYNGLLRRDDLSTGTNWEWPDGVGPRDVMPAMAPNRGPIDPGTFSANAVNADPRRITIIIHTGGVDNKGIPKWVLPVIYLGGNPKKGAKRGCGPNWHERYNFRLMNDEDGRGRRSDRCPFTGTRYSRVCEGFNGFLQDELVRAAAQGSGGHFGLGATQERLAEDIAWATLAAIDEAMASTACQEPAVGHMGFICRQGRHRSKAWADMVRRYLRSKGFNVYLLDHDADADDRGPCGCLAAQGTERPGGALCKFYPDLEWTRNMQKALFRATQGSQRAFDRLFPIVMGVPLESLSGRLSGWTHRLDMIVNSGYPLLPSRYAIDRAPPHFRSGRHHTRLEGSVLWDRPRHWHRVWHGKRLGTPCPSGI